MGERCAVTDADYALHLDASFPLGLQTALDKTSQELEDLKEKEQACLGEILELCREWTEAEDILVEPADGVHAVGEEQVLEKSACYDLDPDHVTKLLRHQMMMMTRYPGCEELVLHQMLQLSSQDGVSLPMHSSCSDPLHSSLLSINAASESNSEQANTELMSNLCRKIKQFLTDRIRELSGQRTSESPIVSLTLLNHIQGLGAILPPSDTWGIYRSIRSQQINQLLSDATEESPSQRLFSTAAAQITRALFAIKTMMRNDLHLLNSGVFSTVTSVMTAIHELYLERITDELTEIVDMVHVALPDQHTSSQHEAQCERLRDPLFSSAATSQPSGDFTELQGVPLSALQPLIHLIEAVLFVEEERRHIIDLMTWDTTGTIQPKRSLKSALKTTRVCDSPPPQVSSEQTKDLRVVESPCERPPPWNWRAVFRKLMPDLTRCVELYIETEGARGLMRELGELEGGRGLEWVGVDPQLMGGRLDYPKRISRGVDRMWSVVETCLPLALAGSEGCFVLLRSSFVSSIVNIFKKYLAKVDKYLSELSSFYPSQSMYTLLSSLAYTRNHLVHHQTVVGLDEASGRPLNVVYRKYCEAVDSQSRAIIDYHVRVISDWLLMDAESHHFSDPKQFYEGERCSFSVAMWFVYLCHLRDDAWQGAPPQLAQAVLLSVLQDSLTVLLSRYSTVTPSYNRLPQLRQDAATILSCVSTLLLSACSSPLTLLHPSPLSHKQHHSIHTTCSNLLAVLAIVTAPLHCLVNSVYVSGERPPDSEDQSVVSDVHAANWLHWLHPNMFPLKEPSSGLQTTVAIQVQLELMACNPHPTHSMLLQALLMKDYTLSILLGSQLAVASSDDETRPDQPSASTTSLTGSVTVTGDTSRHNTLRCLLRLLSACDLYPDALTKVILPITDRGRAVDLFHWTGDVAQEPVWMEVVFSLMKDFCLRCVEACVRLLVLRSPDGPHLEPLHSKMSRLPCGCALQASPTLGDKDIIAEMLYTLVSEVCNNLTLLPTSLVSLLSALQQRHSKQSLPLHVMAIALKCHILDVGQMEQFIGRSLSPELSANLKMLGECVAAVLTTTGSVSGAPRIARLFIKANQNWLRERTQTVHDYFTTEQCDGSSTPAVTDHVIDIQVSAIHTLPRGRALLDQMRSFILEHVSWIGRLLDFPTSLSSHHLPGAVFNPLTASDLPTNTAIHKLGEEGAVYEWQDLLSTDLGVSTLALRTLILNRHEVNDTTHLSREEKNDLQVLTDTFHLDLTL